MSKNLLLISALSFSFLIQAQVKTTAPAKESPSRIKVYTPSGENSSSGKSSKDNSYKWAVKTDVFSIISGEFPLIAEYRFAPKFSAEVSAGVTYAYIPDNLFSDSEDPFNTKAAMGTAFRGALKFYPSADYDAIEGWNFGIQLFSKTTNRDYDETGTDALFLNGKKSTKSKTGISLIIGKQIFEDSNVTIESFFGIGFASNKTDSFKRDANDIVSDNKTETKPNVQLGLRIGFGN